MNLIRKKDISTLVFYIAYTCMVIYWMFSNVKYICDFREYFLYISFVGFLLVFITQSKQYARKQFLCIFLCGIFLMISYIFSKEKSLLLLFFVVIASKGIDFKNLVRYDFRIKIIFLIIVELFYFGGLTNNYYMYRINGTLRSSMGFSHPNVFGVYIFSLCCEFVYLNYGKIKIYQAVLILCLSFVVTYFSDSRGSQYGIIILLVLLLAIKPKKIEQIFKNKVIKSIIFSLFFIFTILSYVVANNYSNSNKYMVEINTALTGRVNLAAKFLDKYDVNLFGNKLEIVTTKESAETGKSTMVLDNAYLKILLNYGIIIDIIFGIMVTLSMKKAINNKDYVFCMIFILYLIRGISGNILFSLYGNVFLIYISNYIYNKGSKEVLIDNEQDEKCG